MEGELKKAAEEEGASTRGGKKEINPSIYCAILINKLNTELHGVLPK